jgi:cytidylate kinase
VGFAVVCISRDVGAGGEEIGRAVADGLGFRYVDEEIVRSAADQSGLDLAALSGAEERQSAVRRLLTAILENPPHVPEVYAAAPEVYTDPPPSERSREVIREAVRQTADEGNVVIVAHAASYVLAGRPSVLRVLVTGSPGVRAERLASQADLSKTDADATLREAEAGRADYLRRFHQVKEELPTHYDLVVNTDTLGVDAAAKTVLATALGR